MLHSHPQPVSKICLEAGFRIAELGLASLRRFRAEAFGW
jgi:hypothetical protein